MSVWTWAGPIPFTRMSNGARSMTSALTNCRAPTLAAAQVDMVGRAAWLVKDATIMIAAPEADWQDAPT
jgi:hypothetical protein